MLYALTCVLICMKEKRASKEMLAFHAGSNLQILHIPKCIHQGGFIMLFTCISQEQNRVSRSQLANYSPEL